MVLAKENHIIGFSVKLTDQKPIVTECTCIFNISNNGFQQLLEIVGDYWIFKELLETRKPTLVWIAASDMGQTFRMGSK